MVFRSFRFGVIARVILLIMSVFLLVYLALFEMHVLSVVILAGLILYQVYDIIHYAEKTNRMISQMFNSIRHSDFSTSFSNKNLGRSFEQLAGSFNEVISEFKKHRAQKEEQFNYLQTVGQHISVGIICFAVDGKVDMYNPAARKMFKMVNLRNIKELAGVKEELPAVLFGMKSGDKKLVKLIIDDEIRQISVYATRFKMRDEDFTLVSMQDIHSELEEKEIESWQRLIRVLTHEIMNSITPISSLASTVHEMLIDQKGDEKLLRTVDTDDIESIENALVIIRNRSQGLLNFVDIYRNLTRIPKPNFRYFKVREMFERAEQLMMPRINEYNIECKCIVNPENLMLTADPDLIDQVIINLLLNAFDAVKGTANPQITMKAFSNKNNRIAIEVRDNGSGIKHDIIDKIFMPFFTSKKGGSGIGLSLSRQIMHLHKGSITVRSKPDEGSVFTLIF